MTAAGPRTVCAWCEDDLGPASPGSERDSHGICLTCFREQMELHATTPVPVDLGSLWLVKLTGKPACVRVIEVIERASGATRYRLRDERSGDVLSKPRPRGFLRRPWRGTPNDSERCPGCGVRSPGGSPHACATGPLAAHWEGRAAPEAPPLAHACTDVREDPPTRPSSEFSVTLPRTSGERTALLVRCVVLSLGSRGYFDGRTGAAEGPTGPEVDPVSAVLEEGDGGAFDLSTLDAVEQERLLDLLADAAARPD